MRFSDIPGLVDLKKSLIHSVSESHVAHAQLFFGKPGSGNLAMAMAYATYLNCEKKSATDSCGKCSSCSKMDKLIHPDLISVFPAYKKEKKEQDKHRGFLAESWRTFMSDTPFGIINDWNNHIGAEKKQSIISVDEGREIIQRISLKAFEAEYKIVLIWLPELMNTSAANSILKVLEEPPEKTLFLLVTNDLERNLTTILSRCQTVNVPLFNDEDIAKTLENFDHKNKPEAQRIALMSDGNMNQAIKLTEESVTEERSYFKEWMRNCYALNYPELAKGADSFQKRSKESQRLLMTEGVSLMRGLLIFQVELDELMRLPEEELDFVTKFSKVVTADKIPSIQFQLEEAMYHIERNANPKIVFMDLSLQLGQLLRTRED